MCLFLKILQQDNIRNPFNVGEFKDVDDEYSWGGRVKNNAEIIEKFLDRKTNDSISNITIHYNADEDLMLLRNYGTLIATRDNNSVKISAKRYSQTTSTIQNQIERLAKDKGMSVERVGENEFAKGGEVYIDYRNKEKNYTTDRKYFKSYEEAEKWAKKEFKWFSRDMISYNFAKGGKIKVGDVVIATQKSFPNAISGMGKGQRGVVAELIEDDDKDKRVAIVEATNGRRVEALIKNLETFESLYGSFAKGGKVKKVEKKQNNEMLLGGLAGVFLGIFLNR